MFNNKFAGYPPVHPIARHVGFHRADVDQTRSTTEDRFPSSGFRKLLNAVKSGWRIWRQRRIDRQAFQHMIALDDHILHDIGVTRSDVIWASRLPLSQNAALELQKLSLQKKKR